ncbi:MAG TPA: hypothetical protein VJZ00_07655 [Thermoanaerobaculia bacterium]|nr:hypothetical protein [Thermoanaerobaculia bacterium]
MNVRPVVRRAHVFAFVFLFAATLRADLPGNGVEVRRGVVADVAGGTLYASAVGGGIDAIDAATGRVLWSSNDAAVPLTLVGGRLVAQVEEKPAVERLRLALIDTASRGRKVADAIVALPDGVDAIVADNLTRSFRVTAEHDASGVVISWMFTEVEDDGGIHVPGEVSQQRIVNGAARVDLETGRVTPLAPRRVISNSATDAAWRAGDVLSSVEGGRGAAIVLKRRDARTGAVLPDRELLPRGLFALPSADRAYLLATSRVGAGGPEDPEYQWSIFSAATGELLGELRREISASPFVVANGNIIFEAPPRGYKSGDTWIDEPLTLRAVRLSSAVPVWDHEVRDLRYTGKQPPSKSKSATPKKGVQ